MSEIGILRRGRVQVTTVGTSSTVRIDDICRLIRTSTGDVALAAKIGGVTNGTAL